MTRATSRVLLLILLSMAPAVGSTGARALDWRDFIALCLPLEGSQTTLMTEYIDYKFGTLSPLAAWFADERVDQVLFPELNPFGFQLVPGIYIDTRNIDYLSVTISKYWTLSIDEAEDVRLGYNSHRWDPDAKIPRGMITKIELLTLLKPVLTNLSYIPIPVVHSPKPDGIFLRESQIDGNPLHCSLLLGEEHGEITRPLFDRLAQAVSRDHERFHEFYTGAKAPWTSSGEAAEN